MAGKASTTNFPFGMDSDALRALLLPMLCCVLVPYHHYHRNHYYRCLPVAEGTRDIGWWNVVFLTKLQWYNAVEAPKPRWAVVVSTDDKAKENAIRFHILNFCWERERERGRLCECMSCTTTTNGNKKKGTHVGTMWTNGSQQTINSHKYRTGMRTSKYIYIYVLYVCDIERILCIVVIAPAPAHSARVYMYQGLLQCVATYKPCTCQDLSCDVEQYWENCESFQSLDRIRAILKTNWLCFDIYLECLSIWRAIRSKKRCRSVQATWYERCHLIHGSIAAYSNEWRLWKESVQ